MATKLYGYGPNNVSVNDDYDLQCLNNTRGRREVLLVGFKKNNAFDGTITIKSRTRGSAEAFVAQAYTKQDGSSAVAAIAAAALDSTYVVDATNKDIRLTTAVRTVGDIDITT